MHYRRHIIRLQDDGSHEKFSTFVPSLKCSRLGLFSERSSPKAGNSNNPAKMSKQLFVQKIALLEGHNKRPWIPSFPLELTIEIVDARIIGLEKVCRVQSPPPMLASTWESLEYRTKRLAASPWLPTRKLEIVGDDVPDHVELDVLKKVLVRLDPCFLTLSYEEKSFDLSIASQHVFHVAGQGNWAPSGTIKDINQLYAVAIELSLKLETAKPPGMIPPGGRPPGLPIIPPIGRRPPPFRLSGKACCGCCSCNCHRPKVKTKEPETKSRWGFLRFGWLRNPFRRRNDRSDAGSVTSTSSSGSDTDTLAD